MTSEDRLKVDYKKVHFALMRRTDWVHSPVCIRIFEIQQILLRTKDSMDRTD